MTGNREYDVAEMLAKLCIRHECKEKTCPVGSAMYCPFHPEWLCGDITSEDWLLLLWGEGREMTEDKKQNAAEMLTRICHREANYGGICPAGNCDDCPFPEKLCTEVKQKDWLEWMEADE